MASAERVTSGIPGMDEMLNGGFIPQSAVLVRGAPGTGKTTFGLQYLLEGVRRQEAGLFVSFEEFPQSLYRDATGLGWDLPALEKDGFLRLIFTSPKVLMQSLIEPNSMIVRAVQEGSIRRVVVDSLSHFTRLTSDPHELRGVYHQVINAFRREETTAVFFMIRLQSNEK